MSTGRLLTPETFLRFRRARAAELEAAEDSVRAKLVHDVLSAVSVHEHEIGLQAACERAWRIAKGAGLPYAHKQVVAKALQDAGWVRKPRREFE